MKKRHASGKAQRPRHKTYRPKPVNPFGGLLAIDAAHHGAADLKPIRADDATDLALTYRLSLEAMARGDSTEDDWNIIACSLNIGLVLCERDIGKEFEPLFINALDGVFRSRLRGDQTGRWRFDGDALKVIQEAFAVHDEQIRITTKEEMRSALHEVLDRVTRGHVYKTEIARAA